MGTDDCGITDKVGGYPGRTMRSVECGRDAQRHKRRVLYYRCMPRIVCFQGYASMLWPFSRKYLQMTWNAYEKELADSAFHLLGAVFCGVSPCYALCGGNGGLPGRHPGHRRAYLDGHHRRAVQPHPLYGVRFRLGRDHRAPVCGSAQVRQGSERGPVGRRVL